MTEGTASVVLEATSQLANTEVAETHEKSSGTTVRSHEVHPGFSVDATSYGNWRDDWTAMETAAENYGTPEARQAVIAARCMQAGYAGLTWKMDFSASIGLNLHNGAGAVGKAKPGTLH